MSASTTADGPPPPQYNIWYMRYADDQLLLPKRLRLRDLDIDIGTLGERICAANPSWDIDDDRLRILKLNPKWTLTDAESYALRNNDNIRVITSVLPRDAKIDAIVQDRPDEVHFIVVPYPKGRKTREKPSRLMASELYNIKPTARISSGRDMSDVQPGAARAADPEFNVPLKIEGLSETEETSDAATESEGVGEEDLEDDSQDRTPPASAPAALAHSRGVRMMARRSSGAPRRMRGCY